MTFFRNLLRYLSITLSILFLATAFFSLWLHDKYVVPIMLYHNIQNTENPPANTVSPQNFQKQMAFLKNHGYNVLSFEEFIAGIKSGRDFPHNSVVITFDDAPVDNYDYAFPIMKQFPFPWIIFLISDEVNKAGYLTWEQIHEMQREGVSFGSHSRRHPYLPELSRERQIDEIVGSKRILEEHLKCRMDYFAFPNGGFSEDIKTIVKSAGYKAACTTNRGYNRFNRDVYEIKRIRFSDDDTSYFVMWLKLSGYNSFFRRIRNPN